jgi:hypothetical protein
LTPTLVDMVESKDSLLKKVGDTPRVKKLTPKTRKKVTARVARDALRARDSEHTYEEETTDEEMVDDMSTNSEAVNGATEVPTSTEISVCETPERAASHEENDAVLEPKPSTDSLSLSTNAVDKTKPKNKKGSHKEWDEMEAFVYHRYRIEAKEVEETTAALATFCREMDGLIKRTVDERNPNQAVSCILAEVKAFMKASIISHTSRGSHPSPAQAADVSGPQPPPTNHTQKQATPKAAACPLACIPRKVLAVRATGNLTPPKKAPQGPPPPKDTNNVQPATEKSYAETVGTPAPPSLPASLPARPARTLPKKKPTRTSRVFVRLPEDSPLRAAHSLYIVKTVNSVLPPGKGVEYTTPVRTGIALTPRAGTTPEDLLQHKERISKSLGDGAVERDENWVVVKIHDLPTQMIALNDNNQLTSREVSIEEDIFPEAAKAFDATPETGCWIQKREGSMTSSIRLTFKEESMKNSPKSVVIMGTRLKVEYPGARGVRPTQCRKCWGLHRPDTCKAEPRCRMCGDINHKTPEHPPESPIKCVNCDGPHAADSPTCPKTAPASQRATKNKKATNKC